MRQFSSSKRGFTLLELIVASAIMLSLSVVITGLFATSKQSLVHGSNKLAIQQLARLSMNRILPYLQTVVPLTDVTKPILEIDGATATLGGSGHSISFSTPHDFNTFPEPAYVPRAPVYYFYKIAFETTPKHELYLEKVQPSGALAPPIVPALESYSPVNIQVLAHGDKKADAFTMADAQITLEDVLFTWVRQAEMEINIKVSGPVRGAKNQQRMVDYELDTRIQFPFYANH
jgi:prepilin-type N-terminal cleavage/methylation domain-containing protein